MVQRYHRLSQRDGGELRLKAPSKPNPICADRLGDASFGVGSSLGGFVGAAESRPEPRIEHLG